jgi:regulator of sirC expression with transglutaminase-like and TPR domain
MTSLDAFSALLNSDERAPLPLLAAAAQVPLYADPDCDPQSVLDQVQSWAAQLQVRVAPDASPTARLRLLNHFFFRELRFAGARDDYGSPENSYLHRVIVRRRGIPITLSLLYIELGKAVGLNLKGVSFPGHFLVRMARNDGAVFIDVFNGGRSLSVAELSNRLREKLPGASDSVLTSYLCPAGEREILARLLRNLKASHSNAQQWTAALEVVNLLVTMQPESPQERLDRAELFERLECPRAAVADLVAYLSLAPSSPDAAEVDRRLARLRQAASRLH